MRIRHEGWCLAHGAIGNMALSMTVYVATAGWPGFPHSPSRMKSSGKPTPHMAPATWKYILHVRTRNWICRRSAVSTSSSSRIPSPSCGSPIQLARKQSGKVSSPDIQLLIACCTKLDSVYFQPARSVRKDGLVCSSAVGDDQVADLQRTDLPTGHDAKLASIHHRNASLSLRDHRPVYCSFVRTVT